MNAVEATADETIATLRLPGNGTLRLRGDGRLEWSVGGRPVKSGDGIASLLTDVLRTGDTAGIEVSDGRVRLQSAETTGASGSEADADGAARETAIPVDQTNLSIIVDNDTVVKLVSAWGSADRAAAILARLEGSGIAPEFRGAVHWELPGRGEATIAIATEFLGGASDGWTWAADDVLAFLGADGSTEPVWPTAVGQVVARLHATLGAKAPTGLVSSAEVAARANETLDLALAAAAGTDTAARLTARRSALDAALRGPARDLALPLFTAHGDLHVGQLLRRPADDPAAPESYRLIDFDGAPQTTSDAVEPEVPAAVDVAHLLTSIDLVGSVVQRRLGAADSRATEWAARARTQALTAYRRTLDELGASLLGDDRAAAERLLAMLEVEQFAREILYAVRYLPRWLYAPDGALTARFEPTPDQEDPPWTPPASPTISD